MLLDDLTQVSAKINKSAARDIDDQTRKQYEERASELQDLVTPMLLTTARIVELRKRGIVIDIPQVVSKIQANIEKIAADYEKESDTILHPNPNWRFETKRTLQDLPASLDALSMQAWVQYVRSVRPASSQALLLFLSESPAHAPLVKAIREREAQFDRFEEQLPTELTIDLPVNLAKELNDLRNDLPDVPSFVRQLLSDINNGTATLGDVTAEAAEWLDQNGLVHIIALSWKNT